MLLSTFGSLWKHTKLNLTKESWTYCKNTRAFTINVARTQAMTTSYNSSDGDSDGPVNAFKIAFKKYKKRKPLPDFSDVIDINTSSLVESRTVFQEEEITETHRETAERLGLICPSKWIVCVFRDRPGLYILPGLLKREALAQWFSHTVQYAKPPSTTNLTAHGQLFQDDTDSFDKHLRWTTLGIEYDWHTKQYPHFGKSLPDELSLFGNLICQSLKLGSMRPDAAIVNFYPPKTTLSPHVDKSERSHAPLVSLSLGQPAVYLSGGVTLSEIPIPIWLKNGDVLVMHGDQRLVYHAIPCVGPGPKKQFFDVDNPKYADYLNSSRVNLTIRQVNP